jgi:hypothetical protein
VTAVALFDRLREKLETEMLSPRPELPHLEATVEAESNRKQQRDERETDPGSNRDVAHKATLLQVLEPSHDCTARVTLLFVSTVLFVCIQVASIATGEVTVKIDHAERRHVGDRRQSAFPDLHERLENKRLAIEHERRRVSRREADRRAVHHAHWPTP